MRHGHNCSRQGDAVVSTPTKHGKFSLLLPSLKLTAGCVLGGPNTKPQFPCLPGCLRERCVCVCVFFNFNQQRLMHHPQQDLKFPTPTPTAENSGMEAMIHLAGYPADGKNTPFGMSKARCNVINYSCLAGFHPSTHHFFLNLLPGKIPVLGRKFVSKIC